PAPPKNPGATLRSRMAEAAPGGARRRDPTPTMPERPAPRRPDVEHSTRLDIKRSDVPKPSTVIEGSDSYDIPVHITASEGRAAQRSAPPRPPGTDFVDDLPTEVFRPGMHLSLGPQNPASFGPVDISGLGDDWDGETVVKKPAALTTQRHREKPPSGRQRPVKPFNPDETVAMKEEPSIEVDIDFDETNAVSPPPRRR
ncbi:MAG: hypothetical protein JWP97_2555, partial [Labilithrix sp.]|nr:hypothetical protein [Labilithrix sp.]